MPTLVSIHSFRRGTGRTTMAANLAVLLQQVGNRVGLLDLNFSAPSLHILFQLSDTALTFTVNDYVWGACDLEACTIELTDRPGERGALFLTPASVRPAAIARLQRGGYYTNLLSDVCFGLIDNYALDYLLVDTQAGWEEVEQLLTAIADTVVLVMRPDKQDFQGTGLLSEFARQLEVPKHLLVVNQVPAAYDTNAFYQQVEAVFTPDFTAVLPHSQKMMAIGSSRLFVLEYPDDKITVKLQQIALQVGPQL